MEIYQQSIFLKERKRGFHLITEELISHFPDLKKIKSGMCQIFIQHTSASLTINENADPTVRTDFKMFFDKLVSESNPDYMHTYEGSDDMPAHLKSSLLGTQVLIPVVNGKLALGMWQGIYLCEHRNHGGPRRLIMTAWGK